MPRYLAIFNTSDNPNGLPSRTIIEATDPEHARYWLDGAYDLIVSVEIRPLQPSDYLAIRFWGKMFGSYEYYIQQEQERAFADKATLDATAIKWELRRVGEDSSWYHISTTKNPDIAPAYNDFLKECGYAS
jgi:hypothetical protein